MLLYDQSSYGVLDQTALLVMRMAVRDQIDGTESAALDVSWLFCLA